MFKLLRKNRLKSLKTTVPSQARHMLIFPKTNPWSSQVPDLLSRQPNQDFIDMGYIYRDGSYFNWDGQRGTEYVKIEKEWVRTE